MPLPRSVMVDECQLSALDCVLMPSPSNILSPQTTSPSNPAPYSPRSLRSDVPIKPVKTYTDPPSSSPAGSGGKKPGAAATAAGVAASGTHHSP